MKQILFIALILLFSSIASAHPGKTDYQDGHSCQKNCEEWDLDYDEYHLHDKDRNPIRLGTKAKSGRERIPQVKSESVQGPLPATPVPERTVPAEPPREASVRTSGPGMQVSEEGMFQLRDIALLVIAGLLFMILLALRTRKRRED